MFTSVSALPIAEQPKRQKTSVFGRKAGHCLYMMRYTYRDNCCKFGISGTFTIPSPLSLGPASLPPSPSSPQVFPPWLQGRSCKCPPRQSLSTQISGTEAAPPAQSLVSLPKGPWQIHFEAAPRPTLCAMCYSCLAPRGLEEAWLGGPCAAKVWPALRPDSSSSLVNPH